MAIFVAFAWIIEAAEWMGLIEIECPLPHSRAYRLAHEGLALLKQELSGRPLVVLEEHSVQVLTFDGAVKTVLESRDGALIRHRGGEPEQIGDLGPGGGVSFSAGEHGSVDVTISARTEDGGSYDVNLTLAAQRLLDPR